MTMHGGTCSQEGFSRGKLAPRMLQGWRRRRRREKGGIASVLAPAATAALDTVTRQKPQTKLEVFKQVLNKKPLKEILL